MDKVSVVICTHANDRLPMVRDAIASVRSQTWPVHEIIVVVDHNTELMAELASGDAAIRVLANANAQGLSGARNCGVAAATGDIIAFIDDDALAFPDWIERLIEAYRDRSVLAVGGYIEPVWPNGRSTWWPEEFDWIVGCSYRGQPETATRVRNVIGCNMSFRRVAFDVCGGFSIHFGRVGADAAGCEETEFCIRAQSAFPLSHIRYDPGARVRHRIDPVRVRWKYFSKRCLAEGHSKAALAAHAGFSQGLNSEAAYIRRVLPAGIFKGLTGGIGGLLRTAAIIAGLGLTCAAYLSARGRQSKAGVDHLPPPFAPIKVSQFDLARPIGELVCSDPETGKIYGGALCLVRENGIPAGIAQISANGRTIQSAELLPLLQKACTAEPVSRAIAAVENLPAASVVVATRDRPEMLAKCLDTLLAQSCAPAEIVVVDSAPARAATRELIAQRYADTIVRYRYEPNPGLGLAHNRGVADTHADLVAFTDDDVLVDRDWLCSISRAFARDERIGCVTGLIMPAELETRAQWWTEAHGGFNKGLAPKVFDLEANRPRTVLFPYAAGMFGSGANMAFSRAALEAIGGFDAALGAGTQARGGDDLAAFTAVLLAGFQLAYEPAAIVWHHHRRTEEGIAAQAYSYGVGLGSYLTKTLLDHPSSAITYVRCFPAALIHILGQGSSKNARLPLDYPAALKWAERRGIAAGFSAYLRSRRNAKGHVVSSVRHPRLREGKA